MIKSDKNKVENQCRKVLFAQKVSEDIPPVSLEYRSVAREENVRENDVRIVEKRADEKSEDGKTGMDNTVTMKNLNLALS